ncbi:class I SAM-dependent methyltransferase [Candidatus Nitrosocosmicus arcticus]|uniref:tRNA (guanine(37)-N(1))-methyltransferase n=1 Tax=Candidatus Nitrosocosmicus arcticus TaxID=2035267 RepID=A0A557SSJ5_9ARCH|nr:class I SAM-dependent methyltransferase family protein [Candidatus Nitrosocosmicus arcticus]TVP39579.1 putative methyltransferase [Candidatus Nitrosocosmicus arcticus]
MSKFLKKLLKGVLADEELSKVYSSFDMIGDIAIIKIPDSLLTKKNIIGEVILQSIKNLKSVFLQRSSVSGEYRLRGLEVIAGDEKYVTYYREYGCKFLVNVATSYFSPRLSTERLRISNLVSPGEIVVNMFAGVGTFSVIMAKKHQIKVYNIDSNLDAYILSIINSKINRLKDRVFSIHGDSQEVLRLNRFKDRIDRVLLPLPERAHEFIDVSINCLKPSGGHLHFFSHIKSDTKSQVVPNSEAYIRNLFSKYNFELKHTQIVRDVAPRIYQTVTDLFIFK